VRVELNGGAVRAEPRKRRLRRVSEAKESQVEKTSTAPMAALEAAETNCNALGKKYRSRKGRRERDKVKPSPVSTKKKIGMTGQRKGCTDMSRWLPPKTGQGRIGGSICSPKA
jgi:hypothetical protein